MEKNAIYHRPESEFAYLYEEDSVHLRLRTARGDIEKAYLIYADPYLYEYRGKLINSSSPLGHWKYQKKEMTKKLTTEFFDYFQVVATVPSRRMDYCFLLEDSKGKSYIYNELGIFAYRDELLKKKVAPFRLPFFHEADRCKVPDWAMSRVWYQIFPERFANGDKTNDPASSKAWNPQESPERSDFYGGDLQGVIDHLDHLTDLGVNGIYFTPIFQAKSNHKYDTEDYFEIDRNFGDKVLFKKLVEEAHKRGIKIMLDAVFNHIGDSSMQWQDVLKNGKASRYADWFHVHDWPASYTATEDFEYATDMSYDTFSFTPHMPKLNTANPEVQDYLLKVADYWIREFDIDAWRLDVANEVDHAFWKKFRQTCDAAKKDFYILGEIWHSAQAWLNGDEFSATMNYAYTTAIMEGLVKNNLSLTQMVEALDGQLLLYRFQTNHVMFNVLDSHDTPRLLTECNEEKQLMKLVEAFTYMQPGVPCIYYGDEYGLAGGPDPDCRKCMPWETEDQDLDLYDFFKKLVAFRLNYQEFLSNGEMNWLKPSKEDKKEKIIQLERKIAGRRIVASFNLGQKVFALDKNTNCQLLLENLTLVAGNEVLIRPKGFAICLYSE